MRARFLQLLLVPAPPPRPRDRAILFESQNFGDRQFVIEGQVLNNLDNTGFNEPINY